LRVCQSVMRLGSNLIGVGLPNKPPPSKDPIVVTKPMVSLDGRLKRPNSGIKFEGSSWWLA